MGNPYIEKSAICVMARALVFIFALVALSAAPIAAYRCGGIFLTTVVTASLLMGVYLLRPILFHHEWSKYRIQLVTILVMASAFSTVTAQCLRLWPTVDELLRRFGFSWGKHSQLWTETILLVVLGSILVIVHRAWRK